METVSFSPDSKQLASGGWDKRVKLWEVQVRGRVARAGPATGRHTPPPTVAPERSFHLPHCPQLAIHLPMRFTRHGLSSSPVKAQVVSPDPVSSHYPGSPQGGPDLTHLRPRTWQHKTSGLPSKAQGSLPQSGQMLRHLGDHRDSIQSSDFAPGSDSLVSHTTSAWPYFKEPGAHPHFPTWG